MPAASSSPVVVPASAVPQDLDSGSRPASRASLKRTVSSQIQPAIPLKPVTPSRTGTPTPVKQGRRDEEVVVEPPTKAPRAIERVETVAKEQQAVTGAEDDKVDEPKKAEVASTKHHAVPTEVKATPAVVPATPKLPVKAPVVEKAAETVAPSKSEPASAETARRKAPEKLDIAAATKIESTDPVSSTPAESTVSAKDFPALAQTPTVSSPSVSSPALRAAPKTIRVVQTPKTETPPAATVSTPKEPASAATVKLPSRKPSIASINLPGTPSSEQVSISDNISVTSTSVSRANSPPPGAGKVGSAPVRAKTKNQLKKERQERAKAIEAEKVEKAAEQDAEKVVEEEPAQAQEAIVSRQKKKRKEKEPKITRKPSEQIERAKEKVETTRTTEEEVTKPALPTPEAVVEPVEVVKVGKKAAITKQSAEPTVAKDVQPTTPDLASATKVTPVATKSPKTKPPRSPPAQAPPPTPFPHEPSPPPTPTLSAAQLLAEIKSTAPAEIQKCLESLFRSPASNHCKPNQPIIAKDLANPAMWEHNVELNLTKAEVENLLHGRNPSLHYGGEAGRVWDRGMVTSTGAHLRALTKELEQRFLELEKMLREMPEGSKFHPSKPQNEMRFPAIDLEGLRRGFESATCGKGVSVMEQMVQDGSMTKKGAFLVDDAARYINEFVMPPATPPPSNNVGAVPRSAGDMATAAYPGNSVTGLVGNAAGVAGVKRDHATSVGYGHGEVHVPSPDIAERQLNEAKRIADERDVALKKAIKKNKKVLGLG